VGAPVTRLVVLDESSSTPKAEQVKEQVTARVRAGDLPVGERLPPVRDLATELDVAVNTVAKAYRELEAAGVVVTRGRAGTFVAGHGPEQAARELAATYVTRGRQLGVDDAALLEHVRRALR